MKSPPIACLASAWLCVAACGGVTPDGRYRELNPAGSPVATDSTPISALEPCPPTSAPRGSQVWRRSVGADSVLRPASVATDLAGNAFVARGAGETFKINEDGSVLWSKPFGSLVTTDADGNAIVAGTFSGSFALGAETLIASGGTDVYVAKLAADGSLLYGIALGGEGDQTASDLAADRDGGVVVSGTGLGTVKLDELGQSLWRREFFGSIAVDSADNVLVAGALTGTANFGGAALTSAGGEDIFVAKLDAAGNPLFSHRFGDAGAVQHADGIAVDPLDNVLVSGVLDGAVDFGGGALSVPPGSCSAEQWCKQAGFVLKLDPSGDHVWSRSRAPVRSIAGIASDSLGNVVASGSYPGNAPPYRTVLLLEFDKDGTARQPQLSLEDAGAGHRVAVDRCDNLLWALSVPPEPGANGDANSFLSKLTL